LWTYYNIGARIRSALLGDGSCDGEQAEGHKGEQRAKHVAVENAEAPFQVRALLYLKNRIKMASDFEH
jgi:hypothetical protein